MWEYNTCSIIIIIITVIIIIMVIVVFIIIILLWFSCFDASGGFTSGDTCSVFLDVFEPHLVFFCIICLIVEQLKKLRI